MLGEWVSLARRRTISGSLEKSDMVRVTVGLGVLAAAAGLMGAAVHGNAAQGGGGEAAKPAYYTAQVKPILDANCARCHGGENHRGGLNMDTREALLKGGHHGPAIVPGDGAKSMMVKLIQA